MDLSATQPRGLIVAVDDDKDDIDIMRLLFRKAGITQPTEVYHKAEDVVTQLTEMLKKSVKAVALPLLCFLDVKMPTMNGHELLSWIRKEPRLDPMSVVMLSSSEHPGDVERAAKNGAQCYLAKYPHPTVLKRVIDEAQRVSHNAASEWFGLPENLLLRWGLHRA